MKCLLINIVVFVTTVNSDTSKSLFLPQLPVGKYRINYLGMMRCVSGRSNEKIQFNLYLSKKSTNTTEIKGNITIYVPIDDSLNFEVNMAVKDSIGGWKENAFFYKSPKACSTLRKYVGDAWIPLLQSAGVNNTNCPFQVGYYESTGIDTDVFNAANFPKTFFYGTYRLRFFCTKNNEVYGCFTVVLEIKRPWETN
ncbi:uncharacterized protein LOC111036318 [Myzus persicae]|uniref:uncharacterized protein LOC111036318 n=1 Tax=Myzus persicae TaxID=13164 RepID=UPI000B933686|nr:uncharacterized protein LOC111036318 [Myzus persicae]